MESFTTGVNMENGFDSRHPSQTLSTRQLSISLLDQREIRELAVKHIKNLGDILANQWKELMSQIPGRKEGGKRFDTQDVE